MFKHTITQLEMPKITILVKQRKCFLIVQLEIVDLLFGEKTNYKKTMGPIKNFFALKEAYPIVRQLEKITVNKAQAEVVKCAKNKSWVPRNPPWSCI